MTTMLTLCPKCGQNKNFSRFIDGVCFGCSGADKFGRECTACGREDHPSEKTARKVLAELDRARAKHPGNAKLLAALGEEYGELCAAMLQDLPREKIVHEALQVACVAIRIIEEGDSDFSPDKEWSKKP